MNYLSKKEHLCDSLSWITLYGYVFFLDTSLIPILRAWSRQTFTSAACVELFQHSQEKISRAFFLWNIQAEGGLSWPQWPRRSWQGHGVDKESVGSWGSEGRKRWDKLLFLSQFFFLFATGRVVLCLVGVHAVFSVLALTFNQYWLILWGSEVSDIWPALQKYN